MAKLVADSCNTEHGKFGQMAIDDYYLHQHLLGVAIIIIKNCKINSLNCCLWDNTTVFYSYNY